MSMMVRPVSPVVAPAVVDTPRVIAAATPGARAATAPRTDTVSGRDWRALCGTLWEALGGGAIGGALGRGLALLLILLAGHLGRQVQELRESHTAS